MQYKYLSIPMKVSPKSLILELENSITSSHPCPHQTTISSFNQGRLLIEWRALPSLFLRGSFFVQHVLVQWCRSLNLLKIKIPVKKFMSQFSTSWVVELTRCRIFLTDCSKFRNKQILKEWNETFIILCSRDWSVTLLLLLYENFNYVYFMQLVEVVALISVDFSKVNDYMTITIFE